MLTISLDILNFFFHKTTSQLLLRVQCKMWCRFISEYSQTIHKTIILTKYINLFINLLFSLSHIFTKVEQKSNEIWKFQMYFLTMEFDNKTALVPPLSIFPHFYLCLKWLARKTCCKKKSKGNFQVMCCKKRSLMGGKSIIFQIGNLFAVKKTINEMKFM